MIKLYGFSRFGELADFSPFVLKMDAYLRLTGTEFELIHDLDMLKEAPKGKFPIIYDQGKLVADSSFIIDYLQQTYGAPLDEHLSDEQLALQHFICKTLEENLYWCLLWSRWVSEEAWLETKRIISRGLPWPMRSVVPRIVRKGVIKSLHLQGMGRHSESEIKQIARKDLQAVSTLLGDKPYILGSQPATADATLFGFLASFILAPLDGSMNSIAREYTNLVDYCNRFQQRWYPAADHQLAEGA